MADLHFEWDEAKNLANQRKHGVSFEVAAQVFRDPLQVAVQDRFEGGEARWQILGLVGGVLVLVVAHTVGEEQDAHGAANRGHSHHLGPAGRSNRAATL